MKKRQRVAMVILILIVMAILTGCGGTTGGKSLEGQILGSWIVDEENSDWVYFTKLVFYDDGTVDWEREYEDDYAAWAIVNGDILKLTFRDTLNSHLSGTSTWTIAIDKDTMRLTNDDEVTIYQRE